VGAVHPGFQVRGEKIKCLVRKSEKNPLIAQKKEEKKKPGYFVGTGKELK